MGKGTILQNLGGGLYNVAIVRDLRSINNKISMIDAQLDTLNDEIIPDLESQETAAEATADTARTELNNAIDDYRLGLISKDEVIAATRNYNQKLAEWQRIVSLLAVKKLEVESLEREKDFLHKSFTAAKTNLQAWCIDGQNDLTGDVGTIEVPGELGRLFIQPGYNGNAVYNTARDGILQPIMSSTPAGVFLNRGILPGWQKFMPTYRVGTIQSFTVISCPLYIWDVPSYGQFGWVKMITGCTVLLDGAISSAQGLNVNQASILENVPFSYLSRGDALGRLNPETGLGEWYYNIATNEFFPPTPTDLSFIHFDIGSRVIVKFQNQNWNNPLVIGFESSPKRIYLKIKLLWSAGGDIINPNDHQVILKFLKAVWPTEIYYNTTITFNSRTGYWEVIVNEPTWPAPKTPPYDDTMNVLLIWVDGEKFGYILPYYPVIFEFWRNY